MGKALSRQKLEKVELDEARSIVGVGTFTDAEIQHLYQRFQTAQDKKTQKINAKNFKAFVERQGLFPSAPKNEDFSFMFRAVSEGQTEIGWESFLRYHLAVKFGFSVAKYREKRREEQSMGQTPQPSTDNPSMSLGADPSSTSGSGSASPGAAGVAMIDAEAEARNRKLLAVIYFHMLNGGGSVVNRASMCRVFGDAARWTAEKESTVQIVDEQIGNLVDHVLHDLDVPRDGQLDRDEFVDKFCKHDAAVFRLVAIL